ncbi:MAG: type II CRISPR RNA-guided endonuclease Cas9 [Clostridia bacterium]|nr:type II CRISPR RNA-guided endonuclease Cas9 [Clostridia bacterium]
MKKFYVGMDIGTESVGMACTDENYNLLRAKGKDLWSVRLFDEAQDASDRRAKRTARRRLQRRKQRILFLQGVFAPFMEDQNFFIRLNNSGFYEEDKAECLKSKFSLFADENYTDVNFYKEYPTIFHLRKALTESKKEDLRHYYLALHHIIKYRGHFLFEGEDVSDIRDIKKLFENYNLIIESLDDCLMLHLDKSKAEEFRTLAMSRKGLNDKKREGYIIFGDETSAKKEMIALLLGAKIKASVIFGEEYAEKYKDEKFSFKDITDEAFEQKEEVFEEEHYTVLKAARDIYNYIVFEKILEGHENISSSMVALYNKHSADLKTLKQFIKENYTKEIYYKIFRSTSESANYVSYIGYTKNKNLKRYVDKKCKKEDFYKFLKKILSENKPNDQATYNFIIQEIEGGTFLPKIINADNGLFPHQINGAELDLILKNLCLNYPEFSQKQEDGYTPAEKIKKIFLFKIPYYVGPLNATHSNAWIVRKEGAVGKITPWNFDDIVDKAKSNEGFIRRMTNKCTYLHNEDVLPKASMYYQAFNVLNQINKLTIDNTLLSTELKQELFTQLFLKSKKVNVKQIKEYLVKTGRCTLAESKELTIGGFDSIVGINATMSSYVIFKEKFGSLVDEKAQIFEDIILWHTLNTDKSIVESAIKEKYGNIKEIKENIKWLKGISSFKEFGRLSYKLLCDLIGGIDPVTGEVYTILNRLYHTNYNFNQLLNREEFEFSKAIESENAGKDEEVTYKDIEELYVSPMVRRGVWQSLIMVDEYVKAVGKAPDKIFLEVTREHGKKGDEGRTISRKNTLLGLYAGLSADCNDLADLLAELNHNEMTDSRLRQERLYLYFLQLGRCAYTGRRINLEDLATDLYDVDHIIPQSMTKDDSLNNKVLVAREKNAEKTDNYPLPIGFTNQQKFWKLLKEKGLMSAEKYSRLTRTNPLNEDDFREFINRQIVVTNQTVKAVAELLKRKYASYGTKIVYSKAGNVDDFKQRYSIVKCRETNDLHHARDAYLNIVVGNIYDSKFTSNHAYFYTNKEGQQREYNLKQLFNWVIDGAWGGSSDVARIKEIASKTSMVVTRYAFVNHGEFYNQTVYSKTESAIAAPRKMQEPYIKTEKYGGFKSLSTAYFAIVQSKDKKGNIIKTIEQVPILVDYQLKNNANALLEYLITCGLTEPEIVIPKLKIKALVSIDGYRAWIAGVTGSRLLVHNAQQWFTDGKTDLYIKQLVKLIEKDRAGRLADNEKQKEEIPLLTNREKVVLYATKAQNNEIYNKIIDSLSKKTYQGLSGVRSFKEKLQEKQSLFEQLSTFNQIKVLLQITRFMKCNAEKADLTLLDDGANCGTLRIGKDITNVNFAIVHQSPCGLVERIQKV